MKFPEAPNIADLENGYLSILHSFWKICAFGVAFFDKKEYENQAASEDPVGGLRQSLTWVMRIRIDCAFGLYY